MIPTEVVVAVIGLVGTLAAAGFGYWQWRRGAQAATPLTDERRKAARQLWEQLEQAHLDLRAGRAREARELLRSLNELLIMQAPFLDPKLAGTAREYLASLIRLDELISASADAEAQERWESTAAQVTTRGEMAEILAVQDTCAAQRETVLKQVQLALG